MKLLVLTFSTNTTNPGLIHLVNSLKKFGYDYHVIVDDRFTWNGNNYPLIAEWLKANRKDYTHILYTDAWDTIAMDGPDEVMKRYKELYEPLSKSGNYWLYSGEKNCYPRSDWAPKFSATAGRWKFLNAGGYIVPIDLYIEYVADYQRLGEDDQEWGSDNFLNNNHGKILINHECTIFQTLYMEAADEFAWTRDGKLYNRVTNTYPVFVHGNGKVDMRWIYHPQQSPFNK